MININGVSYVGNNINIVNGKVTIDGKNINDLEKATVLEINVTGDLVSLTSDMSVTCQNVLGSVSAGGSIQCNNVGANVSAGGSVTCMNVGGSVTAGGSIRKN